MSQRNPKSPQQQQASFTGTAQPNNSDTTPVAPVEDNAANDTGTRKKKRPGSAKLRHQKYANLDGWQIHIRDHGRALRENARRSSEEEPQPVTSPFAPETNQPDETELALAAARVAAKEAALQEALTKGGSPEPEPTTDREAVIRKAAAQAEATAKAEQEAAAKLEQRIANLRITIERLADRISSLNEQGEDDPSKLQEAAQKNHKLAKLRTRLDALVDPDVTRLRQREKLENQLTAAHTRSADIDPNDTKAMHEHGRLIQTLQRRLKKLENPTRRPETTAPKETAHDISLPKKSPLERLIETLNEAKVIANEAKEKAEHALKNNDPLASFLQKNARSRQARVDDLTARLEKAENRAARKAAHDKEKAAKKEARMQEKNGELPKAEPVRFVERCLKRTSRRQQQINQELASATNEVFSPEQNPNTSPIKANGEHPYNDWRHRIDNYRDNNTSYSGRDF